MKKIHYVLGICAIMAFVIGIFLLLNKSDNTMGAQIYPIRFTDLIGTRIASSTTGVAWYNYGTASTTYPIALFGASDALLVLQVTEASSSAALIGFSILGSNDPGCNTAVSSTVLNILTKSEVKWFDALPFLDNASVISSLTGTSTILWLNPPKVQRALHFTNLNMECLALEVNASSTILYGQYKLKD